MATSPLSCAMRLRTVALSIPVATVIQDIILIRRSIRPAPTLKARHRRRCQNCRSWGCSRSHRRVGCPFRLPRHTPRPDSAGNVVYLSPRVTVRASTRLQAFAFVQLPIYSYLYGYQLLNRYTASVGVSYAF